MPDVITGKLQNYLNNSIRSLHVYFEMEIYKILLSRLVIRLNHRYFPHKICGYYA